MNPGKPGPDASGYKAVGLTLSSGSGRLTALVIVAVPLLILLIIGVETAGGSSPPSYYGQSSPLIAGTTTSSRSAQGPSLAAAVTMPASRTISARIRTGG